MKKNSIYFIVGVVIVIVAYLLFVGKTAKDTHPTVKGIPKDAPTASLRRSASGGSDVIGPGARILVR